MEQELVIQPPLYFAPQGQHIWNTHFHPNQDVLAVPVINGHILLYLIHYRRLKYEPEDVTLILTVTDAHRSSARHCRFNPDGSLLASCGQDKRLSFIDATGQVTHKIKKAHPSPINRVHFPNNTLLISGDDDGMVKAWDLRSSQCIFEAQEQSQAITGLLFDEEHSNVISSCLDGTIAVYDLRQGMDSQQKLWAKSDSVDEQLHGLQVMKHGKYLICPSSQNSILVYRRDNPHIFVDRVQGIPGCVQAIVKIDEDTFLAGSEDGFVRAFSLKPNKMLQVVGQHEEDEHFPIQSLALSRCRNIVASTSHDNSIKFYDVSQLVRQRAQPRVDNQEQFPVKENSGIERPKEEESDLFEDMSDSDEMDSEEEEVAPKKKKQKKGNMKQRANQLKKDNQKKFFEGL